MSAAKVPAKPKPIVCSVARRDHAKDPVRTDVFEIDIPVEATLHDLLSAIARDPTPRKGARVTAPAADAHCLEGSCGGCAIRAGGRAVLACTTRIEEVPRRGGVIALEPLGVFPVVRDLVVDRHVRDADGDGFATPSAPNSPSTAASTAAPSGVAATPDRAALGSCIACGACLDACPEASLAGGFVGAEAIVRNRRAHASPAATEADRAALDAALRRPGGIAECGHAQNCVDVCPVAVPLAAALAAASRAAAAPFLPAWLRR